MSSTLSKWGDPPPNNMMAQLVRASEKVVTKSGIYLSHPSRMYDYGNHRFLGQIRLDPTQDSAHGSDNTQCRAKTVWMGVMDTP